MAPQAKRISPGMVSLSNCDALALHRAAGLCVRPGATFLEFAAGWGFSTLCILDAIGQADMRFITSEMAGDCWLALRKLLTGTRAELWEGDLRDRDLSGLELDFLFIDSEHGELIVSWYLDNLFPLVKPGGLIAAHDVLDPTCQSYQREHEEIKKAMGRYNLKAIELISPAEQEELSGLKPWENSHFGVHRACNTLVMEKKP